MTVYGQNIARPPLCDDPSASLVVIRNSGGDPMLLLARLDGDKWGLATPDDPDWHASCVRFGVAKPMPFADIIRDVRSKTT